MSARRAAAAVRCAAAVAACAVALGGASPAGAQTRAPIVAPAEGGAPWTAAEIAALRADVDAAIAATPALAGAHVGVLAVDTASGAPLYARNADQAFQPASTLKLLVGSVALERLGPAYRFTTRAFARPAAGGEELRVVGGGDPFLAEADLRDLARATAASGVSALAAVTVDASRFAGGPYPRGWVLDDVGEDYAAGISAATFEQNVLHAAVAPVGADGAIAVRWTPELAPELRPAAVCDDRVRGATVVEAVRLAATADGDGDLDAGLDARGCTALAGTVARGFAGGSEDVAMPDPPAYLRAALLPLLAAAGVAVGGAGGVGIGSGEAGVTAGAAPATPAALAPGAPGAPVWTHDSAPLAAFLGPGFWIPSDNLVGETLLREVAHAAAGGGPGTTEGGAAIERAWLRGIGVDPATVTVADGSGLSQYDRITPRMLVAILQHDWRGPNRALVLASLPVGGARGTIEGVAGTAAAGRVFAKTGSMSHVRGLAGYLATRRHGAATFAFSVDDWTGDYASLAALRARVLARIIAD